MRLRCRRRSVQEDILEVVPELEEDPGSDPEVKTNKMKRRLSFTYSILLFFPLRLTRCWKKSESANDEWLSIIKKIYC